MIESNPSFGYRTLAWRPGFNQNTLQRIFRLKRWQLPRSGKARTAANGA